MKIMNLLNVQKSVQCADEIIEKDDQDKIVRRSEDHFGRSIMGREVVEVADRFGALLVEKYDFIKEMPQDCDLGILVDDEKKEDVEE